MDILINYNVSENVVAFITELMKSKPVDRMTTMAFFRSWASLQDSAPVLGGLDSFKDIVKNGLDGRSAIECFATESRKFIPFSIPQSNLEDN